jgi:dihydrodipicolinate synthase/N-acetylneuraminate lyase
MARLDAKGIFGIWAGSVMCWDENFRFDVDAYAQHIKALIEHNPHGIYTTGSTGEFFALEFAEFRQMVDIQARLCGQAGVPLQIGCCTDATRKTVQLMEYAASKPEVGAAQVALPYWSELSDREVLAFFGDLYRACPDLPIVHYNISRSKRFLHASDYLRILEVCPTLVGVKYTSADSHFGQLQTDLMATPMLSYFVGENMLASAMQLGARGCYSSVICANPAFMQKFYAAAAAGQWDRAIEMQKRVGRFFQEVDRLIAELEESTSDAAVDKAMAAASGFHTAHHRCRPPYFGWRDDSVVALRKLMQKDYQEFMYSP